MFNDAGIATIDDAVVGFDTLCYGFKMPKGNWMSVDVGPETGVDFEIDFTDALNNDRSLDFSTTHKVFYSRYDTSYQILFGAKHRDVGTNFPFHATVKNSVPPEGRISTYP